jgi:hypothetical protein
MLHCGAWFGGNSSDFEGKLSKILVFFGENFEKICVVVRRCCAVHANSAKKRQITQNQKKCYKVFLKI